MHNGDQYHDVVIFAQQNKAHFSVKVHTRAADFHFYHIYLSCTLDNLQVKMLHFIYSTISAQDV